MKEVLASVGHELSKDKWLAFVLVMVLLVAFVRTSNTALEQLLVTSVGGLLGLMRAGSQNIASGDGAIVKTEPAEVKG